MIVDPPADFKPPPYIPTPSASLTTSPALPSSSLASTSLAVPAPTYPALHAHSSPHLPVPAVEYPRPSSVDGRYTHAGSASVDGRYAHSGSGSADGRYAHNARAASDGGSWPHPRSPGRAHPRDRDASTNPARSRSQSHSRRGRKPEIDPSPPRAPPPFADDARMSEGDRRAAEGRRYQEQLLARCANGVHAPQHTYGPAGIIAGVLLFPVGLLCLFADRTTKCSRCGEKLTRRRVRRSPSSARERDRPRDDTVDPLHLPMPAIVAPPRR